MKEKPESAVDLKEEGNRLYNVKQYDDAIQCYTKAITKNPTVPTFFTNRALCNLKLKRWNQAITDCRCALELDPNIVKGHFFHGQALLEIECYDEAIGELTRAFDQAREQKLNFGDDIAAALRLAKKKRFSIAEEKRITQEIELQSCLNRLLREDRDRRIAKLSTKQEQAIENADEITTIEKECESRITQLNELFGKVDERRKKREVPDFLCGRISFEIMKDPAITPSGITYDRKHIEEHLQRVGHFDPVTRADLKQDQLIPNLAMKEVIDSFIAENDWVAEEY